MSCDSEWAVCVGQGGGDGGCEAAGEMAAGRGRAALTCLVCPMFGASAPVHTLPPSAACLCSSYSWVSNLVAGSPETHASMRLSRYTARSPGYALTSFVPRHSSYLPSGAVIILGGHRDVNRRSSGGHQEATRTPIYAAPSCLPSRAIRSDPWRSRAIESDQC